MDVLSSLAAPAPLRVGTFFPFHRRGATLVVIHAARLREQMFSFSGSQWESRSNTGGFTSEEGAARPSGHQVALQAFASPLPPTYIPNDDVILFSPLYHTAQTGSVRLLLLLLLLSVWIHFDFQ